MLTEEAIERALTAQHENNERVGLHPLVRRDYKVGDTITMPHYETKPGRNRVWKIVRVALGGNGQEGTYSLEPLDMMRGEPIEVPCIMLETHPGIQRR